MANTFVNENGEVFIFQNPTDQASKSCKCGGNCGCKTSSSPEHACDCGGNCSCK